jgi:serine/threonine protein kinase
MLNFQNEAKLIARLDHVNIVTIFDVEVKYKTLFIIYEYLDGGSVEDMIK